MNHIISRVVHAMSTRPATTIMFVLLFCTHPDAASAQAPRSCWPPDSTAAALVRVARAMVSDTTTRSQAFRTRYGVPTGRAADIALVQDTAVCEAVTGAVEAVGTVHLLEALVVVRIGQTSPIYVAMERGHPPAGGLVFLLNGQYAVLATIGGQ
jgi:hypothetical protein